MVDLVLIHPPATLPSEPPVGPLMLAGSLRRHGVRVRLIDANVEALVHLIEAVPGDAGHSVADRRALARRGLALSQLRDAPTYASRDRHHSAVTALRTTLRLARSAMRIRVDLADYSDPDRSPLRLRDLRGAAADPASSPYIDYFEALARRVEALGPRAVGISVNYLHQVLPAMALAGQLRCRLRSDMPLLVGGALISCWRGRLAPDALTPTVDRLVFGDGAPTLLELLGGGQAAGEDRAAAGSIALPDYEGVPWELYLSPHKVAPLTSTRGCFWGQCRYCPEAVAGQRFSLLFGRHLTRTVALVREQSGAGLLHLTDSALPPASLRRLTELDGQLPWYGFARFHRDLTDPDFCRRLRRAGCVMLQLGLESGSADMLRRLNKGIDLAQASAALRALAGAGIASYLYVMFGIPGEGREQAERTLAFVVDHAAAIGFLNVSLLNLPRGTPPEPGLDTRPQGGDGELSLYVGFDTRIGWQRREARRFMERTFARQPRVAAILRRTPHLFGASHAAFFAGCV